MMRNKLEVNLFSVKIRQLIIQGVWGFVTAGTADAFSHGVARDTNTT